MKSKKALRILVFVKRLFEIEVPEIGDGTVEIKGIAREAGYRTKIAVYSKDPKIDCVGACVGMRGARVKNIVQELNGEKIDIVPWASEIEVYCRNAMNPAKLKYIEVDEEKKHINVYVDKTQFSLAIGKHGHNARLTSKLLGWKIDIEVVEKEKEFNVKEKETQGSHHKREQKKVKTADKIDERLQITIDEIEGLSRKVKDYFIEAGYKNISDLQHIKIDELYTIPGIGKSGAEEIMEIIHQSIKDRLSEE